MNTFSQLNIQSSFTGLLGDKISISEIFDKEIIVQKYKIVDSVFKDKGQCLHIQFTMDEKQHVVFTGSKELMDTIQKITPKDFPFSTTIKKDNYRRFIFT